MSAFYDELAVLADEMLTEFGGPAVLAHVTPGEYDPATGTTPDAVTTNFSGVGAKFDYEQKDVDGTSIREGDQRVYLSVFGLYRSAVGMVNPVTGDTLTIDGVVLNVVKSRQLKPADTAVLFDVQCRGVL